MLEFISGKQATLLDSIHDQRPYPLLCPCSSLYVLCSLVTCEPNPDPAFPCFVIQGRVTTYTATMISDATKTEVQDAVMNAIVNGDLARADSRLIKVTWRDINQYPIPNVPGMGINATDDHVMSESSSHQNGLQTWAMLEMSAM